MYEYKAQIVRIIDGDTIQASVDLGFDIHVTHTIRILQRFVHKNGREVFRKFDTPEITRPKNQKEKEHGIKAAKKAKELLPTGHEFIIRTRKKKGLYGRYLAAIELNDGKDYAETMTQLGYAKDNSLYK